MSSTARQKSRINKSFVIELCPVFVRIFEHVIIIVTFDQGQSFVCETIELKFTQKLLNDFKMNRI